MQSTTSFHGSWDEFSLCVHIVFLPQREYCLLEVMYTLQLTDWRSLSSGIGLYSDWSRPNKDKFARFAASSIALRHLLFGATNSEPGCAHWLAASSDSFGSSETSSAASTCGCFLVDPDPIQCDSNTKRTRAQRRVTTARPAASCMASWCQTHSARIQKKCINILAPEAVKQIQSSSTSADVSNDSHIDYGNFLHWMKQFYLSIYF